MKIAKKKVRIQSLLVNPIINLKRPLQRVLKKGKYIAIKYQNTPGDNDSGSYEINFPYYGGGSPEEWLAWKDKLLKALDGQNISLGPLRYMFTERLLTGNAKDIYKQAALDIGIRPIDDFNKVIMEMTKHTFPAYTFCKQKSYLRRHLVKPRSMKLCSFISRLQELNAYLEDFPLDTEGQETGPLPADEIMDIYHYIATTWKNKMIEQDFNYAESTTKEMSDFFETKVENLEPKEEKK